MKAKIAEIKDVDPTLPSTKVEIGGKTYRMCFDIFALAQAERELNKLGFDVDIMALLPQGTLSSTMTLFAASLHHFHPEIGFEAAQKLVTLPKVYEIRAALFACWDESLADVKPEGEGNPPPAAEQAAQKAG